MLKKSSLIFLVSLIILTLLSRFAFLDLRVLHHDESVNYFFANNILTNGLFNYDPTNYHGPLYFYLIALSFLLFGISEFSLRFPAALFGVFLALLPLFFKTSRFVPNKSNLDGFKTKGFDSAREFICKNSRHAQEPEHAPDFSQRVLDTRSNAERYFASFFLLISPSLIYYSRYSIHETVFVFFCLLAFYSFNVILKKNSLKQLPLFSASLALAFTLKETAIIFLFILFVIVIFNSKKLKKIDWKNNSGIIIFSIIIFILIYTILFTSFFTSPLGLRDSLKGFMPWINRGLNEKGHDKPFYYYIFLLIKYEWPILLFALISIYYIFKDKLKRFEFNTFLWFILMLSIYSFIPYKTPWLLINITIPMSLLSSFGFTRLNNKIKYLILIISLIYIASIIAYTNITNNYGEENDFAYVHTYPDILNMVQDINAEFKTNDKILIASSKYWPIPFYLRDKNVSYIEESDYNSSNYSEYKFLIFRKESLQNAQIQEQWKTKKYRLNYFERLILIQKE